MTYFFSSTFYDYVSHNNYKFVGCSEGEIPQSTLPDQETLDNNTIVIFDSVPFIEYCRYSNLTPPKSIIDLFQLFKLIDGTPKKYHKYSEAQVLLFVLNDLIDNEELKSIIKTLTCPVKELVADQEIKDLIKLNQHLQHAYQYLILKLKFKGEEERYFTIEKPFNELLCSRQYAGIHVSYNLWDAKMGKINEDLDRTNKELRYHYNITNFKSISEIRLALVKENYKYIQRTQRTKSFWEFVKTGAEHSELLKLLYLAHRLSHDKRNLAMMIIEENDIVYPQFDCIGTVTSRTLVRRPYIQQLKRTSRDIILAKDGYVLLYADFCQFEPGILASLSGDEELIDCYNNDDLYSSLSKKLFDQENYRSFCKILFLSFMYGMSYKGLNLLIADFFPNHTEVGEQRITQFFDKFIRLIPYKTEMQDYAMKHQKVCTCLGNHRYFENPLEEFLPNKVKRWILSQKVQGTASLILKTAILDCSREEEIEFLLPMHDAALFQVPIDKREEKREKIELYFKKAFSKYCPQISPKISFKSFTE